MNRPLNRRGFLRALAAAPVAAQTGGLDKAVAAAESAGVAIMGGLATPQSVGGIWLLRNPAMRAAWKAGLLPEWAKREIEGHAYYPGHTPMHSDVAALRSVSLSAKLSITRQRAVEAIWKCAESELSLMDARDLFYNSGPPDRKGPY